MCDPVRPSDPLPREFAEAFDALRPRLGRIGHHVLFYDSVGSTNDVVAALAASGVAEGAVVIADAQTAGRGRRGRTWFSPPGSGLYVSLLLMPGERRLGTDSCDGAADPDRRRRIG